MIFSKYSKLLYGFIPRMNNLRDRRRGEISLYFIPLDKITKWDISSYSPAGNWIEWQFWNLPWTADMILCFEFSTWKTNLTVIVSVIICFEQIILLNARKRQVWETLAFKCFGRIWHLLPLLLHISKYFWVNLKELNGVNLKWWQTFEVTQVLRKNKRLLLKMWYG